MVPNLTDILLCNGNKKTNYREVLKSNNNLVNDFTQG